MQCNDSGGRWVGKVGSGRLDSTRGVKVIDCWNKRLQDRSRWEAGRQWRYVTCEMYRYIERYAMLCNVARYGYVCM